MMKAQDDALKKQQEEDDIRKKCALKKEQDEILKKQQEEDDIRKKCAMKKAQNEALNKQQEKGEATEKCAMKNSEDESLKKQQEDDDIRKKCAIKNKQDEALLKRQQEDETRKKCAMKKAQDEAVKKQQEEDEARKKCAMKKAQDEAVKKQQEDEAKKKCAMKKAEDGSLKKQQEEDDIRKKCAKKKAQHEGPKKQQEANEAREKCAMKKAEHESSKKEEEKDDVRKECAINKENVEALKKQQDDQLKEKCELKKLCNTQKKEENNSQKKMSEEEMKEEVEKTLQENRERQKNKNLFRSILYKTLRKQDFQQGNKVSIVGTGAVGMGCAIALLAKGITNNIALYDVKEDLCAAERMDLEHGSLFLNDCSIDRRSSVDCTKDSRIVVVAIGARSTQKESRQDQAKKSAGMIKQFVPELVKQSPKAVYIIVSSPADVMTWVARKVSNLPYERCFSTGCHLDTARFRMLIARLVGVSTRSVHGYVLGEHGDTSVPLWSSVSVGGTPLQDMLPTIGTDRDPMRWSNVHKSVVKAAYKVIAAKGYTNWAIGLTVTDLVSAIFENSNRVLSLSTNAKGMCGITEEIFLSLPCIVNQWGLYGVIQPQLSNWESTMLKKSAKVLLDTQKSIRL